MNIRALRQSISTPLRCLRPRRDMTDDRTNGSSGELYPLRHLYSATALANPQITTGFCRRQPLAGTQKLFAKLNHYTYCRQSQSPYNFVLSGYCCSRAKISFIKSLSIFMKRETLQQRHKQSNKDVFRVCMHSYMYITKVT